MHRVALSFLGLFLAGCCLLAVPSCSSSVIVDQANAARAIASVITATRTVIHDTRGAELDACETVEPVSERIPCLDAGEAHWAPALVAYNLVQGAWRGWLDGLEIAALAQMEGTTALDYLLPLLSALIDAWGSLELALEPFEEIDLPDFPGLGLLGGSR